MRAWAARLFEPIDARSLVVFRFAFGALMCVAALRFFFYGWIDQLYIEPKFFFTYPGFEWVRPWPGAGMYVHFAVLAVLAVMVAFGIYYRAAVALFFLGFTYVELIDKTNYLNHYYLISILAFLMIFMPLDRRTVPRWCLYVLRAQVGMVYFFAGVAKLKADWLFEAQPLRIWLSANTDFPLIGPLFGQAWVAYVASWSAAFFDLTIVFWLLCPRTRVLAFLAVIVFHLVTAKMFYLGMFPWIMITCATLFLPPSWPRFLAEAPPLELPRARPILVGLLAVHLVIQALLPLRHVLFPGEMSWTEDGFRFAWHVMVTEKSGRAVFNVRDPASGRTWLRYDREYLTTQQSKMMSTQPDMIVQLARHIADDFRKQGFGEVEVRVESHAALNGRPSQTLIDPTIDLAHNEAKVVPLESSPATTPPRRAAASPTSLPPPRGSARSTAD